MRVILIVAFLASFPFGSPVWSQQTVVSLNDEPRHAEKFKNEFVRIVDLTLPPGDTTLFHEHTRDIATVVLRGADLTNQLLTDEPTKAPASAGRVAYAGYAKKSYIHRVSNVGSDTFRIIGIEMLALQQGAPAPAEPREAPYRQVLDAERVIAWRLVLEPGQVVALNSRSLPCVRVVESAGKLVEGRQGRPEQTIDVKAGDLQWQPSGSSRSLKNAGTSRIELVEFELR